MVGNVVCSHCESVMPANSKFCPNCGAEYEPVKPVISDNYIPAQPSPQQQPPQFTQAPVQSVSPVVPLESKKSKKNLFFIIAIVAVALLCICILAIIAIFNLRVAG